MIEPWRVVPADFWFQEVALLRVYWPASEAAAVWPWQESTREADGDPGREVRLIRLYG